MTTEPFKDKFGIYRGADFETKEWLRENTEERLLYSELYMAERAARKGGKRGTNDTHKFEVNLLENLWKLTRALYRREYKPSRGMAHVIKNPVVREIFAAPYVDRIVHHFIITNISDWWEKRFCYDSYSCRKGKGTAFGIERLDHHIRVVSQNFSRPFHVIKMDISGYFMHIDRKLLYERVIWGLDQQFAGKKKTRRYKILKHAIRQIIFDDPVEGCRIQGSYGDWRNLPKDKSLFNQPKGRGLVIGNLTSQFFSNIYLDALDRFMTLELGYKHYGRYVDDFYVVVTDEELEKAKRDIDRIQQFLYGLGLRLNKKKTKVFHPGQGVPFLGMVLRNGVIMPNRRIYRNFVQAGYEYVIGRGDIDSIISYAGLTKNYYSKKFVAKVLGVVRKGMETGAYFGAKEERYEEMVRVVYKMMR